MKNLLRTALGVVPGYAGIAVLAVVGSLPVVTITGDTAVTTTSGEAAHFHELALLAKQRRMPYSSVSPSNISSTAPARESQEPDPALWTVQSRYDDLIESTARHHDVDPALIKAIVQAESAFDAEAVSRAGARGLMQVLPATASRFSIKNLSDPRQNLRAGVLYLKHLLDLFDGDVTMAVAAYNAGPNSVRRHRGVPPYDETRNYLTKVMGLRKAYTDPSRRS